jgi:hypothetical protein
LTSSRSLSTPFPPGPFALLLTIEPFLSVGYTKTRLILVFKPKTEQQSKESLNLGKNFLVLYRALADSWFLFDNSLRTPSVIALEEQGRLRIMRPDAYDTLVAQYGNSD